MIQKKIIGLANLKKPPYSRHRGLFVKKLLVISHLRGSIVVRSWHPEHLRSASRRRGWVCCCHSLIAQSMAGECQQSLPIALVSARAEYAAWQFDNQVPVREMLQRIPDLSVVQLANP